jgi:DNA repair exonuclease SbcCD nuclease subunit
MIKLDLNKLICIIGDTHFGFGNNDFLESQLKFFKEQVIPYLKKMGIKVIIQTGDWFDNRNSLSIYVKNKIYELLENDLKDFDIYIYLGNHDTFYKNTNDFHSLKFLSKFSNIHIIEKITTISIYGRNFLFVPWLYDLSLFEKYLNENDTTNIDADFGHYDMIGSRMNKSVYSKTGLTKELLSIFPLSFSGHYHTKSIEKLSNDSELIYVGSPYQLNFGDEGEERGFHILNCENMTYEFIENNTSIKFVSLSYPEDIKEEVVKGNKVNVYINDTGDIDSDKIQEYIEKINSFKPAQNPVIKTVENFEKSGIDVKELKVKSLKELFSLYLEGLKLEDDLKDEVEVMIDELYSESFRE